MFNRPISFSTKQISVNAADIAVRLMKMLQSRLCDDIVDSFDDNLTSASPTSATFFMTSQGVDYEITVTKKSSSTDPQSEALRRRPDQEAR